MQRLRNSTHPPVVKRGPKEKTLFATRDLQDALSKVDLSTMQARVDAGLEPLSDVAAREIIEEEEVNPTQLEVAESSTALKGGR